MKDDKSTKTWSGVGRRKTAVASVRIYIDKNQQILINDKKIENNSYLNTPFELLGNSNQFSVSVHVRGGGKTSQEEAIRLGISRALQKNDPDFRPTLKKAGFLTRDPRKKERKKPGLKRARRAPQWSKR